MKQISVTVTISGTAGSGKSTVLHMLKNILTDSGFNVKFMKTVDTESEFNIDKRIESVKNNTVIYLNELQTRRMQWKIQM
jgi:ABC-type lipoprotein export system ATPase subunit